MIYPFRDGLNSAKVLSEALGVKRIKLSGSSFKGGEDKIVINWGAFPLPLEVRKCMILNSPEAVALATDKLRFFKEVYNSINVPDFTEDKDVAEGWVNEGIVVLSRETLVGHSAVGLVVLDGAGEWESYNHSRSKLYVKYIPKKDEFRVHVVCGQVVDVRRKSLRSDFNKSHANWKVRNHANGFIFAKDGFEVPDEVVQESVKATMACGLDFGAVDVIWNNFQQKAFVLEINTAPGLEGSTVDSYANGFKAILEDEIAAKEYGKRRKLYKTSSGMLSMTEILAITPMPMVTDFASPEPVPQPVGYSLEDVPMEDTTPVSDNF